jgi:hypothetical protein
MEPQPPPPAPAVPPPAYRVYSPGDVALATFLGAPVAGAIVLALNYRKWGQKPLAAAAVAVGFLVTAVFFWLAWITPSYIPAFVFLLPQVVGGYFVAKWLQGRRVEAHLAAGGPKASTGRAALIGLAFTVLWVGAFAVWFFSSGVNPGALMDSRDWVDFGHGQTVYYSEGATRNDARHFGEALKDAGYFDDTVPTEVFIKGRAGDHEISFVGIEGAWDDETNLDYIELLVEYIAADIGGEPIKVLLLNDRLYAQKACVLRNDWACEPVS